MKSAVILSLILFVLPPWVVSLQKDKLTVFASLSYYGCDFDGDKLGDLSVWNPKTNTLYFQLTSDNKFYEKKFFDNAISFQPVFADYDGDSKTDFAFFQPDAGQWVMYKTSAIGLPQKTFLGIVGDLPVPVNTDGDKKYELGIWRPSINVWLLTEGSEEDKMKARTVQEGSYQDSVNAGDYDGDGKSDLIVWRPDDGYWHIVKSGTNFDFNQSEHIQHGQEWDVIVPNDYNNDKKCDLVFWRPENQTWHFLYAGGQGQNQLKFGEKGDIPLSNDLDGDGIPELITWNVSKKSWNVLNFKKQESFSYKWNVPDGCLPAVSILQKYE